MREISEGSVLSGHRIDGVVGRGGMGVVYRAQDLALRRTVALKVIAPELLEDARARERFLREARAAASIDHPHVIPVLHAGEAEGVPYLVMRFVDGDDVRTLVRRSGPLDPERAARIVAGAGEALDAIHAAGLVHRDVKPANVLLGPGDHVYVTDFGLAKHAVSRDGQTRSGQWVGTLDFVAPEQIRGERADARADVYALGGLLFFMLTGAVPFSDSDGDEAKLWAHLTETPPSAALRRPELSSRFDAVIARAMAKDPRARYSSAGDVGRAALAAARGAVPTQPERVIAVGAAAPGAPEPSRRRANPPASDAPTTDGRTPAGRAWRRPLIGAAVAMAVLAVAVGAVVLSGGSSPSTRSRTPAPSPPSAGVRLGATIADVMPRPNSVAVTGGALWVGSAASDEVVRLDARTGRRQGASLTVRPTLVAMASAGRSVWIALARPGRLIGLDAGGGRLGAAVRLPGDPTAIDATRHAVWVAVRGRRGRRDLLLRYDPVTRRRTARVSVGVGARALAAAPHGVWVGHRATPTVAFVDGRTLHETASARLRQPAYDLAYGAGYVWASLRTDDSVARIDSRTGRVISIAAPHRPMQIAVAGGRVLVAGNLDDTVGVIDAYRARPIGRPLPAGFNPFAAAGDGRHVWVTSVGSDRVTRFDVVAVRARGG